jgi:Cu-Zn family superoxide dismutase
MRMSHSALVVALTAFLAPTLAGTASSQAPKSTAKPVAAKKAAAEPQGHGTVVAQAHATIAGQGITGAADFTERKNGTVSWVEIHLTAKGLKPGSHGVHLHAIGKCEPDFTAAGGHFDPGPAGNMDPDMNHPFHMGDVPQIVADAAGNGTLDAITTRVTLTDGPLTLFDTDGSAIVIHGNPDQGITGEKGSGVSGGPRVACGVIEKK